MILVLNKESRMFYFGFVEHFIFKKVYIWGKNTLTLFSFFDGFNLVKDFIQNCFNKKKMISQVISYVSVNRITV